MTTLVTGATGHLGANLVRALLERKERTRVLVRPGADHRAIQGLDVEIAEGDLRDEASLRRAVEGCQYVYHCAAFISIRDGDRDELVDVNIRGTGRLMRVAREAGVERLVHTSSFGAMATKPGQGSNEEDYLDPFESTMDYERTKAESEHVVLREVVRGLDAVIVNPSATVGPWDFGPSHVGKTIVDFAHGRMPAYVPGAFDWVPMKDVIAGHLLAMEKGKTGERYLLSGEVHTIDEILDWLAELTGAKRPRLQIPPKLMQSVALVKDDVEKRLFPDRKPTFNYHAIRLLTSGKQGDNTKARTQLGLEPTPAYEAFKEAVEWFKSHQYF